MRNPLAELRRRAPRLAAFGMVCWIGGAVCIALSVTGTAQVSGIPAFVKPAKFFLSVAIASWTFGWLLHHLDRQRAVRQYSTATVVLLGLELLIITRQAARGVRSHFNYTTPFDLVLFQLMGVAILVYTVWTAVLGVYAFRQKVWRIPPAYVWGIRFGIAAFVIFAFEGGVMAALFRHTVGGEDGGAGLPFLNWSTRYGDLRIAHFVGMHALQVLPLAGWLLREKVRTLWALAGVYFALAAYLLVRALMGLAAIG